MGSLVVDTWERFLLFLTDFKLEVESPRKHYRRIIATKNLSALLGFLVAQLCKPNRPIDSPAFCAIMKIDSPRHWEEVCGEQGSAV